jgi:hypothetical protein
MRLRGYVDVCFLNALYGVKIGRGRETHAALSA